jgi:hypothetical protein
MRNIEQEADISQMNVMHILHQQKCYPGSVSLHKELHGNNFHNRILFGQWDYINTVLCDSFWKMFCLSMKNLSRKMGRSIFEISIIGQ